MKQMNGGRRGLASQARRSGQVLMAAVFILIVVCLIGAAVVSLLSSGGFSAYKNLQGAQALNIAEAGIRYTIATSLAADSDWSDNSDYGPVALGLGSFTVHYTNKQKKSCSLEVTAQINDLSRTVVVSLKKSGGLPSQFSDFVAYGGSAASSGHEMLFNNNAKCYGNIYYYGPIRFTTNARQSGGIIRSLSITPPVTDPPPLPYASWEAITTYEPVSVDTTYYNNWLNSANVSAANYSQSSGTVNLSSYPDRTLRGRSITLSGSAVINGPGTICATANPSGGFFTLTGNAKINGYVRIIARGNSSNPITFSPSTSPLNPVFNNSIEVIANSYINFNNNVIVPRDSILYAGGNDGKYGVQISDNSYIKGSTIISPVGVVRVMNNATMEGRLYAESLWTQDRSNYFGTSWVFLDMVGGSQIKDWSVLTQADTGMPSSLPPGISSEGVVSFESWGWEEKF